MALSAAPYYPRADCTRCNFLFDFSALFLLDPARAVPVWTPFRVAVTPILFLAVIRVCSVPPLLLSVLAVARGISISVELS